jgi:hypothetical protein
VTPAIEPDPQTRALTQPFPVPGRLVQLAYRELDLVSNGAQDQLLAFRDLPDLPRPWDPATCETPQLRKEVWSWLEAVVTWLNHEYVWDVADVIPPCWPQHSHLVHEIAVLADQRRRAGLAPTSDPLEEWHRYSLPSFTERMKMRLRNHCQEDHHSCPAKGRYIRHIAEASRDRRLHAYAADANAVKSLHRQTHRRPGLASLILAQARSRTCSCTYHLKARTAGTARPSISDMARTQCMCQ